MDLENPMDFFSLARSPARMPPETPPRANASCMSDSDEDDDFALPVSSYKPKQAKPDVAAAVTVPAAKPAGDDVGGCSADGGGAGAAEAGGSAKKGSTRHRWTVEDFVKSPQVASQKNARWDDIERRELGWFHSFPVLVVPPSHHITAPSLCLPANDGVRAYGPSAKTVTPASKRYVVVQYLPMCCTSSAEPKCEYGLVKGCDVEKVVPYNTMMKSKQDPKELGPVDKWADLGHHRKILSKKKGSRSLQDHDWKIAMDWAQKYLDRALELEALKEEKKKANEAEALEQERLYEEEIEREKREEEAQKLEAGGASGEEGGDKADKDEDDSKKNTTAEPAAGVTITITPNLKLAPGDKIFYWDGSKRVGTAVARREAVVLEILTKDEGGAHSDRIRLDNNEVVLDDWVIRKFKVDKKTGIVTDKLDHRGNELRRYRLVPGKLEGGESRDEKIMKALMADFREDAKAYGVGHMLRDASQHSSDDDDSNGDEGGDDAPRGSESPTGPLSRKGDPRGRKGASAAKFVSEEDEGDAIAAFIASRKRKKGGGSKAAPPAVDGVAKEAKIKRDAGERDGDTRRAEKQTPSKAKLQPTPEPKSGTKLKGKAKAKGAGIQEGAGAVTHEGGAGGKAVAKPNPKKRSSSGGDEHQNAPKLKVTPTAKAKGVGAREGASKHDREKVSGEGNRKKKSKGYERDGATSERKPPPPPRQLSESLNSKAKSKGKGKGEAIAAKMAGDAGLDKKAKKPNKSAKAATDPEPLLAEAAPHGQNPKKKKIPRAQDDIREDRSPGEEPAAGAMRTEEFAKGGKKSKSSEKQRKRKRENTGEGPRAPLASSRADRTPPRENAEYGRGATAGDCFRPVAAAGGGRAGGGLREYEGEAGTAGKEGRDAAAEPHACALGDGDVSRHEPAASGGVEVPSEIEATRARPVVTDGGVSPVGGVRGEGVERSPTPNWSKV